MERAAVVAAAVALTAAAARLRAGASRSSSARTISSSSRSSSSASAASSSAGGFWAVTDLRFTSWAPARSDRPTPARPSFDPIGALATAAGRLGLDFAAGYDGDGREFGAFDPSSPRGIRNNNPGNIERGEPWRGLAAEQTDPRFAVFSSPVWGLRAMAVTLATYRERHGLRTIGRMIGRWAPSHENDTGAYARTVATACGISADAELIPSRHGPLMMASMIGVENGRQPYPLELIARGAREGGFA